MELNRRVQMFYRDHPLMVSSPFGGVDGINRELFAATIDRLGIDLRGKRVLDIGCGRGFAQHIVRERGGTYTGVDFVPNGIGFPLAQGDANALPFQSDSFDVVFCIDAFEHFPQPLRATSEIKRVLRDNGTFFLSAPNYSNVAGLVKKFCEHVGSYERNTWAPFGRWQPQEWETPLTGRILKRIFRTAGFRRTERIGHPSEIGLGLFPWIDHPRMPEAIQFRLQRLFGVIGPAIAAVWPGASLHGFWKIEC